MLNKSFINVTLLMFVRLLPLSKKDLQRREQAENKLSSKFILRILLLPYLLVSCS